MLWQLYCFAPWFCLCSLLRAEPLALPRPMSNYFPQCRWIFNRTSLFEAGVLTLTKTWAGPTVARFWGLLFFPAIIIWLMSRSIHMVGHCLLKTPLLIHVCIIIDVHLPASPVYLSPLPVHIPASWWCSLLALAFEIPYHSVEKSSKRFF